MSPGLGATYLMDLDVVPGPRGSKGHKAALRTAGYWNSGQECGAACRVLVHESVAAEFTDLLIAQVESLIVGEPGAGDDVEIGPLISKAHFDRVRGFLDRARADGARAALGG